MSGMAFLLTLGRITMTCFRPACLCGVGYPASSTAMFLRSGVDIVDPTWSHLQASEEVSPCIDLGPACSRQRRACLFTLGKVLLVCIRSAHAYSHQETFFNVEFGCQPCHVLQREHMTKDSLLDI